MKKKSNLKKIAKIWFYISFLRVEAPNCVTVSDLHMSFVLDAYQCVLNTFQVVAEQSGKLTLRPGREIDYFKLQSS